MDIDSEAEVFEKVVHAFSDRQWKGAPIINGVNLFESMIKEGVQPTAVTAPYDRNKHVGNLVFANLDHVSEALNSAAANVDEWRSKSTEARGEYLNTLADLMERDLAELVALCHHEAGKRFTTVLTRYVKRSISVASTQIRRIS